MSLSSALDSKTGRISSNLIPPRIAKGELITGGYGIHLMTPRVNMWKVRNGQTTSIKL